LDKSDCLEKKNASKQEEKTNIAKAEGKVEKKRREEI
jgi:hypothetical protein